MNSGSVAILKVKEASRSRSFAYLDSERFDVVGAVGAPRKVGQVELDLVPAVVEPQGHGADERLDARRALVVAGAEASAHVLVVEHLHLEREVLFQILDDHDQKGQLDAERLGGVSWTRDVGCADVCAHNFQH